jgi:hypothetical protein
MPARSRRRLGLATFGAVAAFAACSGPHAPPLSALPAANIAAAKPHAIDAFIYFDMPERGESKPAKSVEFEVKDFGFTLKHANLSPGGNCIDAPAGTLRCKISEVLPPRPSYTVEITTFDKPFAPGATKPPPGAVKLSQDTVPVYKYVGGSWVIHLDMYEQPKSIFVTAQNSNITGSQKTGFTLNGPYANGLAAAPFTINALDSSDHFIVGPGAPRFYVKSSSHVKSITVHGDVFAVWIPRHDDGFDTTITAGTIPPCSVCLDSFTVSTPSTPTPSPSPSPSPTPTSSPAAIFVTYSTGASAGTVVAYDEQGNLKHLSGNFSGSGNPSDIVWDPHIVWFYLTAGDTGTGVQSTVQVFGQNGTHLPYSFKETTARALAVDSNLNRIYVSNVTAVVAYGEFGGTPITLNTGLSSAATMPNGLAFDAHLDHIIAGNFGAGQVQVFDESGNQISLGPSAFASPVSCTPCTPAILTVDPSNADVYVVWINGSINAVTTYNESGNTLSSSGFSGLTQPTAIVPDSHNGLLYVTDGTSVKVFNAQGVPQSTTGTFNPGIPVQSANGVAIIPPP